MMFRLLIALIAGIAVANISLPFIGASLLWRCLAMGTGAFLAAWIGRDWLPAVAIPLLSLLFLPGRYLSSFSGYMSGMVDRRLQLLLLGILLPLLIVFAGGIVGYALSSKVRRAAIPAGRVRKR